MELKYPKDPHVFGFDKVVLFFGVVEDRNDPLKLGRCKVRIFAVHPEDQALVTTEQLPWAMPIMPITGNPGIFGMGFSPVGPTVGTHVVGFFADGLEKQQPFFFGIIPGSVGHFNYGVNQEVPVPGSDGNSAYGPIGDGQLTGPIILPDKGSKDVITRSGEVTALLRQQFPFLKDFQAAGMVGNLVYESGGLRAVRERGVGSAQIQALPSNVPPPKGTKRVGYGWAQWTNTRLDAFLNYAEKNNLPYDSDQAQAGYLISELKSGQWKKMMNAYKAGGLHTAASDPKGPHDLDTIEGSTAYFMGEFERPAKFTMKSLPERIQRARSALAALNKSGVPVRSSSQQPTS
jgi:hypothetical protein